jgi:GntR family transcriptional regulator/MocR family aminotransferase
MEPDFELSITLPEAGGGGLLRALHAQLRAAILDGRLRAGLRMPSTRALAALYRVSRNTTLAAYDLLLSEGYLLTRARGGTYVAGTLARAARRTSPKSAAAPERRLNPFWRQPPRIEGHSSVALPPPCDFRLGSPDESALRFDIWQRLAARAMRSLARSGAGSAEPRGGLALREAIARHVSFTRAVACGAGDLVVTSGTQQALDLLARILVTPGKTVVAVEDPGYPPARAAFAAAGARVVPVPVDAEGLMVERLPADAKMVYVTPSHQFPLGCVMSMQRRTALLAFAQRHGAVIIEDDYDGEFRFGERPLDALQTLDRSESVFYLGTFSKSLFPALRLGFVAAPGWALAALAAAKQCADGHCSVPLQDTLAAFIAEGHLARHVRRMRQVYGERRQCLLALFERDFGGILTPLASSAGLHLAAYSAPSLDLKSLAARALAEGVGIYSLQAYYASRRGKPGLAFGYGVTGLDAIEQGMARLARLVR